MTVSTSFRISDRARTRLAARASQEGLSATALLERLIIEGVDSLDHPGIVHRGAPHQRRAALAAGPDVWEIIARLRQLEGDEEDRIAVLAEETELAARQIRVALDYAAAHPAEVEARIERNGTAIEAGRRLTDQRRALLG